ncbi:hypothetical protein CR513_59331, partial [Mucuna pruriens]
MKESQMPSKTYARSSEKRNRRLKDSPNFDKAHHNSYSIFHIINKCLNAALASISEAHEDSSPISEISYANRSEDDNISSLEEALPKILLPSYMMQSKKMTEEEGIGSAKCFDAYELECAMSTSTKSEIAAIDLINAKPNKDFNSHNVAPQYRKLMDEITKYVVEDLYMNTVPEDYDRSYHVLSAKNGMVFLYFCIWIMVVLAIFFFTSNIHCPPRGPLPTSAINFTT